MYAGKKEEGIEFLGHQPQRELKRFYAAADVLLMPFPHTEHYAFFMSPLKMFEYMMSGIPMIVTELPSVRDILSEREAVFAKPGDVSSLADAITSIIQHPQESRARADAAKQLSTRYTWMERATRIASWLKNV
jgi:glycosyltransferase involved in cell wall biosynthesis